jgi:hypothetical protein
MFTKFVTNGFIRSGIILFIISKIYHFVDMRIISIPYYINTQSLFIMSIFFLVLGVFNIIIIHVVPSLNYYKKLKTETQKLLRHIVYGLITAGVLSLITYSIVSYFNNSSNKSMAYDSLVSALSGDTEKSVRVAAIISLGNIQDEKAFELLHRMLLNDSEYSEYIKIFLSDDNDKARTYEMLMKLRSAKLSKNLRKQEEELINKYHLDETISRLRILKSYLSDKVTQKEDMLIQEHDTINNIDNVIDRLSNVGLKLYGDEKYNFDEYLTSIDGKIKELQLYTNITVIDSKIVPIKIMDSGFKNTSNTIRNFINLLSNRDPYDKIKNYDLVKYASIIQRLLLCDYKTINNEFCKIALDSDNPRSLRLMVIRALGIRGSVSELKPLIECSKDNNLLIRKHSIISLGMILSKLENKKNDFKIPEVCDEFFPISDWQFVSPESSELLSIQKRLQK